MFHIGGRNSTVSFTDGRENTMLLSEEALKKLDESPMSGSHFKTVITAISCLSVTSLPILSGVSFSVLMLFPLLPSSGCAAKSQSHLVSHWRRAYIVFFLCILPRC